MNLDLKTIKIKIKPLISILSKYYAAFFLMIAVFLYAFLILRIGSLSNIEPTEDEISSRLKTVVRPRIDPEAIKKIQELKAQKIDIDAAFTSDRSNPFQE